MQVDEIKERQEKINASADCMDALVDPPNSQRQERAALGVCFWLSELCLQQAEANEHLAKTPMAVNAESPWVTLARNGNRVSVDRSKVSSVAVSIREGCILTLQGSDNALLVDGSLEEVCAKLGIPVA